MSTTKDTLHPSQVCLCAQGCARLSSPQAEQKQKVSAIVPDTYSSKVACSIFQSKCSQPREQHFKILPKYRIDQIQINTAFEPLPQGGTIVRKKKISLSKDFRSASNSSDRSNLYSISHKPGIKLTRAK